MGRQLLVKWPFRFGVAVASCLEILRVPKNLNRWGISPFHLWKKRSYWTTNMAPRDESEN